METIVFAIVLAVLCVIAYAVGHWHGRRSSSDGPSGRRDVELKALAQDLAKEIRPAMTDQVTATIAPGLTGLKQHLKDLRSSLDTQNQTLGEVTSRLEGANEVTSTLARSTQEFTLVLKSSQHRGKWGEQTLRRVIEESHLSQHCDFCEQGSTDGKRPDVIIRLEQKRCIVIDSKVPEFGPELAGATPEERRDHVVDFAGRLKQAIKDLSAKRYPDALKADGLECPQQVVLFLPAESLLSAALEGDPELLMYAQSAGIVLATPSTLMAVLGAVNWVVQQHKQSENARQIVQVASDLYDRVTTFIEHLTKIRKDFGNAVDSLNNAFGSYDKRIRPQGRRLQELGVRQNEADREFPELAPLTPPRQGVVSE